MMIEKFKAKLLIIDKNLDTHATYRDVRFKIYDSGLLIIKKGNESNDYIIIKDYISLTIRNVQEHMIIQEL